MGWALVGRPAANIRRMKTATLIDYVRAHAARCLVLPLVLGLAGCAAPVPQAGETVYLEVREQVSLERLQGGWTRNLRNALAHGVTPEDLAQGRVASATCAETTGSRIIERSWWVRVPPGVRFTGSIHHREFAELYPGAAKDSAGPLGEVAQRTLAPLEHETLKLPYPGTRVACSAARTPGAVRAEVISVSNRSWLDELDLEDAWMHALPREALEGGRIFRALCALGTDRFEYWYLQAPPQQVLQRGQVVRARAGNSIGAGAGPVSQVIGVAQPDVRSEQVFGSRLVRCSP